jgi:hypothetical protein
MIWIIVLIVIAIFVIVIKVINDNSKDEADMQGDSLDKKFSVVVNILNDYAFNGKGRILDVEPKTKWAFNLYDGDSNQIIKFLYFNGNLLIEWRYKYFQKEVIHKKRFDNVRNLSIFEQQQMAAAMIKEMEVVITNHKSNVLFGGKEGAVEFGKMVLDMSTQSNTFAQQPNKRNQSIPIAPVKINGKGGFIDTSGNFIINPIYDSIDYYSKFSEGLLPVSVYGNKYGYIDITGNFVIEPKFDVANDFSEGLARVEINGKSGYINITGSFVIEPKFDDANNFNEGFAHVVINGKSGYIDKAGKYLVEPQFYAYGNDFCEGFARVKRISGGFGFIDRTGKLLDCEIKYFDNARSFSEGFAAIRIGDDKTGKWGFIDKTGKIVIPLQFEEVDKFTEGYSAIQMSDANGKYSFMQKWGFIDKTGKIIIAPQFSLAYDFQEGLSHVHIYKDKEFGFHSGYIDKTGKFVIPAIFDAAGDFNEGLARVRIGDRYDFFVSATIYGKWGVIDYTGKSIINPRFDYVDDFSEGFAAVNIGGKGSNLIFCDFSGGKWGYVDKSGQLIIPLQFDEAGHFTKTIIK